MSVLLTCGCGTYGLVAAAGTLVVVGGAAVWLWWSGRI